MDRYCILKPRDNNEEVDRDNLAGFQSRGLASPVLASLTIALKLEALPGKNLYEEEISFIGTLNTDRQYTCFNTATSEIAILRLR
jgi:hypothetical protein